MTDRIAAAQPSLAVGAVRGVVRKVLRKDPHARAIAIRWDRAWTAQPVRLDGVDRDAVIHQSDSPLAIRSLFDEVNPDELLVLLTACDDRTLGADALSRVSFHRLHEPDRWEAVLQVFGAQRHVRSLNGLPELADALVDLAPANGYPRLLSGTLDLDTAWRTWARMALDLAYTDAGSVLRASATGSLHLRSVSPTLVSSFGGWLADASTPLAATLLRVEDRLGDGGAAATALVSPVLFDAGERRRLLALGQLTELLGVHLELDDLRALAVLAADAQIEVVARAVPHAHEQILRRAEDLVERLRLDDSVAGSDVLPAAFAARLTAFGVSLAAALGASTTGALEQLDRAAAECARHRLALEEPGRGRVRVVEMAVRAVRWLQSPVPPPGSFGVSAARYALEGSWTDVVWRTLWAGDTDPTLKTALAVLTGRVADRQRAEYRQFAQTLPGDDPSGRHPMHATDGKTRVIELVPVERVLAQVVAPLARVERVLVIVLDGYSIPVHQQVLPGLASEGWSAIAPDSVQMQVGVAMLPTVTDVSRASLLSGMATTGGPDSEDRGFAAALASLQPSAKLFHHGALAGTAGEAVAAVVAIAIASDDRVVGLVLNTVDDTLAKGTFPLSWSLAQLPKLADVLRLADEAGRIIVLTADHGHLVQQDMVMRAPTETGGERWRPASGAPAGVDEVTVRGPRVLRGDGAVALPWGDDVRYAPKKGGYHGGASPAEVLVPLVVLTRDVLPVGFGVASTEPPPWWNGASPAAPSIAPAVTTSSRRRPSQEQLFEVESRGSVADDAVPAWVSALLDSSLWKTRSAGRRQILDRPKLELLFAEFARRGGVLSFAAISELTEVLAGRVQGLVATLAPQCNIDGFAILTSDPVAAEARLDVAQLQAQFGARTTGR